MKTPAQEVEYSPIDRLLESGLFTVDSHSDQTLSVQIYQNLREALLSGTLGAGDQLNIRPIAAAFGTSTMPVRDAMTRLVVDGGLSALPNRAFVVETVDERQMRELNLMRLQLEPLAAKFAATRQSLKSLRKLEDIFDKLNRSSSPTEYLAQHRAFHFHIYDCADMPFLYSTIETIWLRFGPFMNKAFSFVDVEEENKTHGRIVSALQSGDPNATATAVEEDLRLAAAKSAFQFS
ncbi:MAG: GntR family transcriptional regulator [Roseovarius sp.]